MRSTSSTKPFHSTYFHDPDAHVEVVPNVFREQQEVVQVASASIFRNVNRLFAFLQGIIEETSEKHGEVSEVGTFEEFMKAELKYSLTTVSKIANLYNMMIRELRVVSVATKSLQRRTGVWRCE